MNTKEEQKALLDKSIPKDKKKEQELLNVESDATPKRSNSHYTKKQVEMMNEMSVHAKESEESRYVSSTQVRIKALNYFMNDIEAGTHIYVPSTPLIGNNKADDPDKLILKNIVMTVGLVSKCNRFAKAFGISSAHFRRDALEYYYSGWKQGKYKEYEEEPEILKNIENEKPDYKKE